MTETNKKNLIEFVKVLCLVIVGFAASITNAEIWNMAALGATDSFHVVVSIVNLLFEGVCIYIFGKRLFKK